MERLLGNVTSLIPNGNALAILRFRDAVEIVAGNDGNWHDFAGDFHAFAIDHDVTEPTETILIPHEPLFELFLRDGIAKGLLPVIGGQLLEVSQDEANCDAPQYPLPAFDVSDRHGPCSEVLTLGRLWRRQPRLVPPAS